MFTNVVNTNDNVIIGQLCENRDITREGTAKRCKENRRTCLEAAGIRLWNESFGFGRL